MKRRHILYVLLGLLILFVAVGAYFSLTRPTEDTTLIFPDSGMHYEIVTTLAQQERGLGGRKEIPDNYGMLFVFPQKERYGFWMKDMLVSIDIIWLNDDGTISKIDANVAPETYPKAYYPPAPLRYVLETQAGFASRNGWHVGSKVPIPESYIL